MDLNWKDKTILVVDDTEVNYILLKTQLRKTNANIIWIENGQKAVDYVKNNGEVDIVLMDIRMPVLDGLEATKLIKAIGNNIPVVIQTASAMGDAYNNIQQSGCDDTIFKPINSEKLIDVIYKQFVKYSKQ